MDNTPPKYVLLNNTALIYDPRTDTYYRDAGCWSTGYRFTSRLEAWNHKADPAAHLNGTPLIETTFEIWREDNRGYI